MNYADIKLFDVANGTGVRVIFLISRLPEVNLSPA